jgi:outer membrane protein assembly factor BamB
LPRDIAVGRKGDLLFCIRNLNLIGILGLDEERIVWTWGPDTLDRPHQPTVLDNGNILVFDNGTHKRKHSRVIELDPSTGEIVWLYESSPPEAFFSKLRGSNQRLANGNTLITESDRGHVFEVTPEGETVWDFWNFETNEDGLRSVIYRMTRYDPGFLRQ